MSVYRRLPQRSGYAEINMFIRNSILQREEIQKQMKSSFREIAFCTLSAIAPIAHGIIMDDMLEVFLGIPGIASVIYNVFHKNRITGYQPLAYASLIQQKF